MKLPLADIGGESEKSIVAALDDLFGPSFREVGQYLADKVRLHRLRSLKKILEKAKEFGPPGQEFLAPPSLKFLLTFTEKASLEESDELCDLWARLLVEATQRESARLVYFADIISKISPAEAALFDQLVLQPRVKRGALSQISDAYLEFREWDALRRYVDAIENAAADEAGTMFGTVARLECFGGRVISAYMLSSQEDTTAIDATPWSEAESDRLGIELLQQLGLVRWREDFDLSANGMDLHLSIAYVTPLGAEFFYSTHDPMYRLPPTSRAAGTYPDSERIPINAEPDSYLGQLDQDDVMNWLAEES